MLLSYNAFLNTTTSKAKHKSVMIKKYIIKSEVLQIKIRGFFTLLQNNCAVVLMHFELTHIQKKNNNKKKGINCFTITTSAVGVSSPDGTDGVFLKHHCCSHRGIKRRKLECTTVRDKGKGKEFPET